MSTTTTNTSTETHRHPPLPLYENDSKDKSGQSHYRRSACLDLEPLQICSGATDADMHQKRRLAPFGGYTRRLSTGVQCNARRSHLTDYKNNKNTQQHNTYDLQGPPTPCDVAAGPHINQPMCAAVDSLRTRRGPPICNITRGDMTLYLAARPLLI